MTRRLPLPIRLPAGLLRCNDGISAVEFAIIAPVFFTLMFGIIDLGQMAYGQAMLNGAVQKAARDSSLEGANTTTADNMVIAQVGPVLPGAVLWSSRVNYVDFNDIGRSERYTDTNGDGTCNNREPYVDENGNGHWDAEIGEDGNGGANDVVVYTVTATYTPLILPPLLPARFSRMTLTSSGLKKNQPYANQIAYNTFTGTC